MLDFWLAACALILLAVAVLVLPLLRRLPANTDNSREAANLALYQERLAELRSQLLSPEQLSQAETEAARALLADSSPSAAPPTAKHSGRTLILLSAVLLPLLAFALYLHWGASAQLALTRELAQPPASVQAMFERLNRITQLQPDAVQGWYLLGRAYMAAEQPQQAANAFAQAAKLSNRAPEVLGKWAEALYFAADKQWSASIQALTDEALQGDPNEMSSLGLLGIAAFEQSRWQDAIGYWQRLAVLLPAGDPSRQAIEGGIARARDKLQSEPAATDNTFTLAVRVALAPSLKDKVAPSDSLFVFIRAAGDNAPNMPLAVKRLQVADLPLEIVFTDNDAMLPALKPSAFGKWQVLARISKNGQPTTGEWLAQSKVISAHTQSQAVQELVIEQEDIN